MQNTGIFYLYEVEIESAGMIHSTIAGVALRAQCHRCHRTFYACGPPLLVTIAEAGTVISCPGCGERQALALAYLRERVAAVAPEPAEQ